MKNSKMKSNVTSMRVKCRLFVFVLLFFSFVSILGYNCVGNLIKLNELKNEKEELEEQIVSLIDEKENLEADVERLSDSTYIARYAREKYLYSKEGEIIIRLSEEE